MDEEMQVIEVSAKTYNEITKLIGEDRDLICQLTTGRTCVVFPLDGIAITVKP